MSEQQSYREQQDLKNTLLLREILRELPPCCAEFFRGVADETLPLTRLAYARDLLIFFDFLLEYKPELSGKNRRDVPVEALNALNLSDFEIFLEYLTYYERGEKQLQDREAAKERKLSSLRSFFGYLFKRQILSSNVAALVDMPKRHEKAIVHLEIDEVAKLLDLVEDGAKLTKRQQAFHAQTKARDLALISLLLGTGIRVSECVGLNLSDIDFDLGGFKVTRKGGSSSILYFPQEVEDALRAYIGEREKIEPFPGHENALFLSLQRRRMDVRTVQNLVKKYARVVTPLKKISPHKLRSTFGTSLYRETGDIYLVADVLGHSDVNTTRRHYAAMGDENRRIAAHAVRLRDDGPKDGPPAEE
ncbi:MAG: tyrosine-type recombinase/integrase [Christensenellaceae bacterium]|jgi:site-specific recombinase XerD|nr:tyrosine-type recombinase/integrase [Christensenellaceae bacterium]